MNPRDLTKTLHQLDYLLRELRNEHTPRDRSNLEGLYGSLLDRLEQDGAMPQYRFYAGWFNNEYKGGGKQP